MDYKKYHKQYREKNREYIKQKNRLFRENNPWIGYGYYWREMK